MQNTIALSFFALSQQSFAFDVYRKLWEGETKEEFPNCTKRKLPANGVNADGSSIYQDYWVSLEPIDNFEVFRCESEDNPYLTLEVLMHALYNNCKNRLDAYQYEIENGFRSRIFFKLASYSDEGYQSVWLEPYYLKSLKKFGFLADFKFFIYPSAKHSKKTQQLSLSLDKDGRSNINFYADRYEMLQKFISRYFDAVSTLNLSGELVLIDRKLTELKADELKQKKYVFAEEKIDASQFVGVKNFGPYGSAPSDVKLYFLYRDQDKIYSQDLFRALRGDTFSNTFPGVGKMFRYTLDNKSVGGKAVKDFSPESLTEAIRSIHDDANGRPYVPVVVVPFSKFDENESSNSSYYLAKHTFLRHHLPSQFVSLKKLETKDQLKWAVSNIGLQIFAKMGGLPWIVSPQTSNCLIVGLGQAHKKVEGRIEKYFAYSVLTESTGLYKDLKVLGLTNDESDYSRSFRENLIRIFEQYIDSYDNFVVHVTFSIRKEEIEIIQDVLSNLAITNEYSDKKFVVMRFNDENHFFGYSRDNNSKVPFESSYIQLSNNEFLVWFEGLQYHNPTIRKRLERPLYIKFVYPNGLSLFEMRNYLQDALNLSGANWRGFNAKSLPVSVYYAKLVADYYKEFQSLNLEDFDVEKITPWFL